jgi:hypothetical protein
MNKANGGCIMKLLHSVMLGSMLVMLMSVSVTSVWAEDGHRHGDRNDGMVAQRHDRGDRGVERRDGRDRGVRRDDGRSRVIERRDGRDRGVRRDDGRSHPHGFILDQRYHHDRYYPPRGYVQRELPRGYMMFRHHGDRYFYRHGIWYRSSGLGFIVVTPPFGIVVPVLPPYYTTVWIGGIPYYYANGVYYVWQPVQQGYVITQPPAASSDAVPQPQQGPDQFYVYPKKGQSADQQAKDRYECHRWAVDQSGFDPSQPAGNLSDTQLITKREDYRRAIEACLDARGYSVK